jgi:hypothetical protein
VGSILQLTILKIKIMIGAIRNIYESARVGTNNSLKTNLAPSAIGCNKPQIPTTFGPLRRCIAAITLRSAIVK